ncbi:sensor histidine kinase [Friedmanniella luteola]|uniref:sensor histidine kinase n=1 Tax=Friedmanniella luteola TaxID=546871 RepID=UPI00155FE36A|nr:HAMP domain-containing sensor histidine kinase [Friedmanniella luteola]
MGSVNHHLRTPLTVVLGHAELLTDREDELPPEVRQSLACLLRAAERLNDVVVEVCALLDVACVGPDPHTLDVVDLSELVADEVVTYGDRAARRGVQLVVSGEPAQSCVADSRRLRLALRRLLDDALAQAADQSTVGVASTTTETGTRIEVTHQGADPDADEDGRPAPPSGRDTHRPRPPDGQGLGLALASAVAAWHGGRLVLSPRPGRGGRACLELPARTRET